MVATISTDAATSRRDEITSPAVEIPLSVELHSAADRSTVLGEWKKLDGKINDGSLANSWIWTKTWLEHYGDLVPHRFVVGRRDGQACGLCLLTEGVGQRNGPFSVKTRHIGTAGEPDLDSVCVEYNCLLVESDCRTEFVRGLQKLIHTESSWEEFRLDGFAPDDADTFLENDEEFQIRQVTNHYFDLQSVRETGDEIISRLGYSTRKNIRKNLKAYGSLRTQWAETPDQAESIFADLVRLHQERWQAAGQPGVYASPRFLNFHRALNRQLVPTGQVGLFRVTCDEDIVGCVQLLIDRNRALCYQGGSAPYTGKLSPGVVVDFLCMQECLSRGLDAYDFLGGDTDHKRKLSTDSHQLCWCTQRRPRLKYALLERLRKAKWALKQIKKEC